MVIIKANEQSEAGQMPTEKILTEMGKYNEELVKAGIMKSGEGLHPSSRGKRVRFSGSNRTVIDGPFAEAKELVAGFWIWEVKSMQEAVEWVKRMPSDGTEEEVELRQVGEVADFGPELTAEARERGARVRAELERQQKRS
jgi:hypothetical protein